MIANINITVIESNVFSRLLFLERLHIDNVILRTIGENGFSGMASLPLLNLSRTSIKHVGKCAFCNMSSLVSLDLSHNLIAFIIEGALMTSSKKGLTINLTDNPIAYVEGYIHIQRHISILIVEENSGLCCFTSPSLKCDSNGNKVVNICGTLLLNFQYVVSWILLIVWIIGGNLCGIVLNFERKATQYHILQTMAFADILYGLHMLIILCLHYLYDSQFVFRSKLPSNLLLCKTASVLLHVSLITSRTSVLLITINYLLVTKYALKFIRLTKRHILISLTVVWFASIATYSLLANEVDSIDSSPLCTSFNIPSNRILQTLTSALLVAYLYCSVIITGYIYYVIIQYTNESARKAGRNKSLLGKLFYKACFTVIVYTITTSAVMVLQVGHAYGLLVDRRKELWLVVLTSLDASLNSFIYTFSVRLNKKSRNGGRRAIKPSTN